MARTSTRSTWHEVGALDEIDRVALSRLSTRSRFGPGERLIEQGQEHRQLFFIVEGAVQVIREDHGVSYLIIELGINEIVGELAFVTGRNASATVRCLSDVEVEVLSAAEVEALAERDPGLHGRLCLALTKVAATRIGWSMSERPKFAQILFSRAPNWAGSLATIRDIGFSPLVHGYVERYEAVAPRSAFLWRWATIGVEQTRLSCVAPELLDDLRDTKLLAVILNVMIDDIADVHRSIPLLETAIDRLSDPRASVGCGLSPAEVEPAMREYFELIHELWQTIVSRCAGLPCWARWRELWRFDYFEVLSCMRYAVLLGHHPSLTNLTEHGLYPPHNMNMMVFSSMDLMASPDFDPAELGALREIAWLAQNMGQISNMTVTWRRELDDRDFTSRIYAHALERGVLSLDELETLGAEDITTRIEAAQLEHLLIAEWHAQREQILAWEGRVRSFDVGRLAAGLESLLGMTLAARRWL